MRKYLVLLILTITGCIQQYSIGQTFTVEKAPFSTNAYDEFSPVYYGNGLVFCSNRNNGVSGKFVTPQDKGLFSISFITNTEGTNPKDLKIFSREITSKLNDGPATFNRRGDTVYFSRNLIVEGKSKEIESVRNKLGIFYAVKENDKWTRVRELRFNNEWFNITTPYLSPDGKRLYFASDKDGGYGGSDLYYCKWRNDFWDNPVNLGPTINTKGNEAYPFVTGSGELFFSSDGHPGIGGKDIYYTKMVDTLWISPVLLQDPVNTTFNDFAFIYDSTMSAGYFSSDRDASLDIFSFKTDHVPLFYCEVQHDNHSCFRFIDDATTEIDPLILQYEWEFGQGKKFTGLSVDYCFPGPGEYMVNENITEKKTGLVVFTKATYKVNLVLAVQGYITSADTVITGEAIQMDASESFIPGSGILSYNWEIDSVRKNGIRITHTFDREGEHIVKLGIVAKDSTTGINKIMCVSKTINVFSGKAPEPGESVKEMPFIENYKYAKIDTFISAGKIPGRDPVFHAEIISSPKKLDLKLFNPIQSKYIIKEIFIPEDSSYSYIADEQPSLMAVYPAFKDASDAGFKQAIIKTFIHSDPAEIELSRIKKAHDTSSDIFFLANTSTITFGGMAMLEQIVLYMKKYPAIKLYIANHTDNRGNAATNLSLSSSRSVSIANYLANKEIDPGRLIVKGYGGTRPVTSNLTDAERKRNRRVEFVILN